MLNPLPRFFLVLGLLAGVCIGVGCEDPYAPPFQSAAAKLELRTKPPNLGSLFDRKLLPSGALATDEQVRKTIQEGKGIMPPFGQMLDKENLDDLVAYLHKKK